VVADVGVEVVRIGERIVRRWNERHPLGF
jgi:hypothetical protein